MTIHNFNLLKTGHSALYQISPEEEKNFRSALGNWMKRQREKGLIVITCKRLVERDIFGKKIFLGMKITREE